MKWVCSFTTRENSAMSTACNLHIITPVSTVHHLNLGCARTQPPPPPAPPGIWRWGIAGCDTRLFQAGLLIVLFSEVEAGQVLWERGTMLIWGSPAAVHSRQKAGGKALLILTVIVLHFGHLAHTVIPRKTYPSHMQDPSKCHNARSYLSCVGSNSHHTPYQCYTSVISLWALIRGRWVSESLIVPVIGLWISFFTGL